MTSGFVLLGLAVSAIGGGVLLFVILLLTRSASAEPAEGSPRNKFGIVPRTAASLEELPQENATGENGPAGLPSVVQVGWLAEEASRRVKLGTILTIWGGTSVLLFLFFFKFMQQLEGIDQVTRSFMVCVLPVMLGFAVAHEGGRPFRRKRRQERQQLRRKVPPTVKKYEAGDLTESGFPYDYRSFPPSKSSRDLQKEHFDKRDQAAMNRFDKWNRKQFSLYNVFDL